MRALPIVVASLAIVACSESKSQQQDSASATTTAMITMTSKSPEAVEHLKKGEVLLVNIRTSEAAAEFEQALKLDPDFILAHAYHGQATPGPAGLRELESAANAASTLPEGERTLIQGILATRQGESAKARDAYATLTTLVPGDWRGHYLLGTQNVGDENYAAAVPSCARPWNWIRPQGAPTTCSATRRCDKVTPKPPSRHSPSMPVRCRKSQMRKTHLARRSSRPAGLRKPKPHFARPSSSQQGSSLPGKASRTRSTYSGDAAAALDAVKREKEAAVQPNDKLGSDRLRAVMTLAKKRTAEGLTLYSDLEKMIDALPTVAFVPVERAGLLVELGRAREAMPIVAAALKRADSGELPAGLSRNLRQQALRVRVAAEAAMNNAQDAEATAMELQQLASQRKDDVNAQSAMRFGLGMAAMAKRDYAGARSHFEQCLTSDEICRLQIVMAATKAGDKAGAEAARAAILKLYIRSPAHVWIRARLQDDARQVSGG